MTILVSINVTDSHVVLESESPLRERHISVSFVRAKCRFCSFLAKVFVFSGLRMAIFFHKDVHELLENKKLIVIGDSIQRSVYKDLICLWTQEDSRYLFQKELRAKGELAFLGDKLLRGGKLEGKMVNGTGYREVREFSDGKVSFKYYFVTRSYSEHMESILNELKTCQPDVIVMNSTFWDLHHYGDNNLEQYKANLEKLVKEIAENFSSSLLFIWNAALPLADRCKGGFLRKGFVTIPIDKIKTANKFAWLATTGQENSQKKVYLDLFTELKDKGNFTQAEDGIHWGMRAHRKISNLILTEVCTAWNRKIPDPPSQLPSNKRSSSPVLWSQFYPDNDTWSPVSTSPYNDYDELEYWNYVPQYWGSPSYDRYQTPSPLLSRGPSFYGSGWSNLGWSYNAPYGYHMGRTNEYQPSPPAPYIFPRQYLSLGNMQFNFSSPYGPYYPEKVLFKPAYSEPLPLRSSGQGLLPTPPGPPSYAYFNEGDRYRDRFKKLSNPRARRFKPSATTTSTPLSTKSHTTHSTPTETPKSSLSTDHNTNSAAASITGNSSDHNNNKEQVDSVSESCLKSCSDSDAVDVGTESVEKSSESTIDSVSAGGSFGGSGTQENDVAQQDENAMKPGLKRKREDDEESSNPSKIAREETTDVQRSGLKRKLEDIEAEEVTEPLVSEQANSSTSVVNGAVPCEQKRSRKADVTENPNPPLVNEDSTSTENSEKLSAEDCPEKPTSSGLNLVRHDEVRCALTYDSFI